MKRRTSCLWDCARRVLLSVAIMLASWTSHAQTCDCPPVQTCSACVGGLTALQLQYLGSPQVTLSISDNGGILFAGLFVSSGQIISLSSSAGSGQPFVGNVIHVSGLPLGVLDIDTSCGTRLTQGTVFNNIIKVIGATVAGGQPLCCSTSLLETSSPIIAGCPANLTVTLPRDACEMSVSWDEPTASDNCTLANFTRSHNPGDLFSAGTTIVTYTATDIYGNISTCTFDIEVRDRQDPRIDCPNGAIQAVANENCVAFVTWDAPIATDNCSVTVTSTHEPGDEFPIGNTRVVYTATDPAGNTKSCQFNVVVKDQTPPSFTGCPSSPITSTIISGCGVAVSWTEPILVENCSATITKNFSPGDVFPLGTTTVTYTATDGAGNVGSCSFNVVVTDIAAPVISNCPANITVAANDNCQAIVNWIPPSSDPCVQFQSDVAPESLFSIGETLVMYTATDGSGNTSTCSFTVTVVDQSPPVIVNCPSNIVAYATTSCTAIVEWTAPLINGNCGFQVESSHNSGSEFPVGETLVTISASDAAGNVAECTFTVTVEDRTAPIFTQCPSRIEVSSQAGCQAPVSWTTPIAADNCSFTLSASHTSGSMFSVGTTFVTYTATDASGNKSECSFEVVVKDAISPVLTNCPQSIIAEVDNDCSAIVSWSAPTSSDNCSASVTSTHTSGSVFPLGVTEVTYTATDASGNSSTCSFTVEVLDNDAPIFESCPNDIVVAAAANCSANVTWTLPTVKDACETTLVSTHQSGDQFPVGSTTVIYTAKDASGNTSTCSFVVTVTDAKAPIFAQCVSDLIVEAGFNCSASATWSPPVVHDCNLVSLTSSHAPGSNFGFGNTAVTYTATDADGNTTTCTFNVTVQDKSGPVFESCPQKIIALANEDCKSKVTWIAPAAVDQCGTVSLESSHSPGTIFEIGTTTVTYKAVDEKGNWSTCSFDVEVKNAQLPEIQNCPADILLRADESGSAVADWDLPTASVNCAEVELSATHTSGESFGIGITPVTYTAQASNGQRSTCTFKVEVEYEEFIFEVNQLVTPDGDGFNDHFTISNIEKFKDNKVVIVDRWGSVVFEASGYNNENVVWSGRNLQGVTVPAGTYFYTVSVRFLSSVKETRGFIELVR